MDESDVFRDLQANGVPKTGNAADYYSSASFTELNPVVPRPVALEIWNSPC